MNRMSNPIAFLRTAAVVEGVSYLVLLFIAMPLKYFWEMPQAVRIVGMAHGVLFIIFCVTLFYVWVLAKWPFGRVGLLFLASIVPFGPWLIDRRMRTFEEEFLASRRGRKD